MEAPEREGTCKFQLDFLRAQIRSDTMGWHRAVQWINGPRQIWVCADADKIGCCMLTELLGKVTWEDLEGY